VAGALFEAAMRAFFCETQTRSRPNRRGKAYDGSRTDA
jgi:hypothetical protein